MATTRTATKKPATRKPKPATAPKPALHGVPALLDRVLLMTERMALRIAVMAKRAHRTLVQHA